MCFLLSIILLCDCARLVVVVVHSGCRHRRIPRSVVAVVFAPSVIVSSATDLPTRPRHGRCRRLALRASRGQRRRWLALAECLEHQPRHDVIFMLVVPARLRCLCCCPPPPKTPFPKSVEDDLQEIARARAPPPLPCWCRRHPPSQRRCRRCSPDPPAQ